MKISNVLQFWNEENLIADEFSGELADGLAYVAGHDDDSRPVIVIDFFNFILHLKLNNPFFSKFNTIDGIML